MITLQEEYTVHEKFYLSKFLKNIVTGNVLKVTNTLHSVTLVLYIIYLYMTNNLILYHTSVHFTQILLV